MRAKGSIKRYYSEVQKHYENGGTDQQAARIFGFSKHTLRTFRCEYLKIVAFERGVNIDLYRIQIQRLVRAGHNAGEISRRLGLRHQSLRAWLSRNKISTARKL